MAKHKIRIKIVGDLEIDGQDKEDAKESLWSIIEEEGIFLDIGRDIKVDYVEVADLYAV